MPVVGSSQGKVNKRRERNQATSSRKESLKRMWQSFRKQITAIRGIINELAPIVKHSYPGFGFSPLSTLSRTSVTPTVLSTQFTSSAYSTSSIESVKVEPVTPSSAAAQSYRLVTGYYGISKEIFFGKNIPVFDKQKTTFGDDSWY